MTHRPGPSAPTRLPLTAGTTIPSCALRNHKGHDRMNDRDPATHSWHIDRRIPVALIITFGITIAGQTGAALWWAATTSGRLTAVENSVQNSVTSRLNRIEDKLDRLMETSFSATARPR